MIFKFLRQFIKDDEFEQIRNRLEENDKLVAECKETILNQKNEENNKVDPDFLALIWASIGAALALGVDAVNHFPDKKIIFNSLNNTIWSIFVFTTLVFIIINLKVALELTIEYAKSKSDNRVKLFAYSLVIGMAILVIGIIVLSSMNSRGL